MIAPVIRSANATKDISLIKEAFNCSLTNLHELQLILIDFIVKTKSNDCFNYLKNANDIPRLYRRTNREIPKQASNYVTLAIQVIYDFKQKYSLNKSSNQQEQIEKCVQNIIDSICIKYQSVVSDLLESVKKMEDSLKRLQRVRQNKNASSSANLSGMNSMASSVTGSMSDDDKIRLQLFLDITDFGKQLEEKCNGYKGDSNYESLYKLVEEITNLNNNNNNSNLPIESINNNNNINNNNLLTQQTNIEPNEFNQ
jgi:conserved oligomeric Golgi complex subunit 2